MQNGLDPDPIGDKYGSRSKSTVMYLDAQHSLQYGLHAQLYPAQPAVVKPQYFIGQSTTFKDTLNTLELHYGTLITGHTVIARHEPGFMAGRPGPY